MGARGSCRCTTSKSAVADEALGPCRRRRPERHRGHRPVRAQSRRPPDDVVVPHGRSGTRRRVAGASTVTSWPQRAQGARQPDDLSLHAAGRATANRARAWRSSSGIARPVGLVEVPLLGAGAGCRARSWWPGPGSPARCRPRMRPWRVVSSGGCTTPSVPVARARVDDDGERGRPRCAGPSVAGARRQRRLLPEELDLDPVADQVPITDQARRPRSP